MALLYRVARLHDRANTHVFTFVVTRSVTRDLERDITSKELACGFQKWAITFSRTDKVLGVYLVWRNASEGMRVYVDFTFTLLNREHFSVNEGFSGKQVKFTFESPAQGNRNYIPVSDLYGRNFTDPNGEFQLELTMANLRTVYATDFRLPPTVFGVHHTGLGSEGRVSIYLNRLTGFDHRCRVRYAVALGEGTRRVDSGPLEDVSDAEGRARGWHPRARLADIALKGVVRVQLDMQMANTVCEVAVASGAGAVGPLPAAPPAAQCYDRDKQAWTIKSDCHSETVRLQMVYKDIHNVPRNHLRYVSWTAYIMRYHKSGPAEPLPLPGVPFSHYYAQENSDEGIIMETDVTVKEIREPGCPYLTDKSQLRVQIEWDESYLLFQATYHKYDDVCRIHNFQMRREIATLQAENYSLERQLFSYQRSIACAHSRGTYSDDLPTPDGICGLSKNRNSPQRGLPIPDPNQAADFEPCVSDNQTEVSIAGNPDEEHCCGEERCSLGERSLSTETEYA
ncbi:uncharacterized protein LOC143915909 [Arctopsyche grandis]|uniref:uncharacterized protein LOC143915909 n=1 Tax=Arctopsyche grandis TaxID=121162 RepID=UPI00406DA49E